MSTQSPQSPLSRYPEHLSDSSLHAYTSYSLNQATRINTSAAIMQPQKILFAAGLFALASAEGFRVVRTPDTEKLPLPEADMSYIGPAFDGGDDVEVSGTIESVAAQLRGMNPDWHPGVVGKNTPSKTDTAKRAEVSPGSMPLGGTSALRLANSFPQISPPLCNDDLGGQRYARTSILNNGADYLKGLSGTCRQPPRSCGRVSCSYDAGVTFCNDGVSRPFPS